VPANENAVDPQDGLISAAHAAASWARARRASWTSAPLTGDAAPPPAPEARFVLEPAAPETAFVLDSVAAGLPLTAETAPVPIVPASSVPPILGNQPGATAAAPRTPVLSAPVRRWFARGAIAAALVGAVVVGGQYLWSAWLARPARTPSVEPKPAGSTAARPPAGSLRVSSTPAGAQVVVDGKVRGVTPLDLTGLSPGRHDVTLQGDAGTIRRTVTVDADATATIDEAIFSGFVTVHSPFEVTVTEKGRVLRADDRQQIMLPAGAHELRLGNRALGYDVVRQVDVKPGDVTNLQLTPDPSTLTVTAAEAAEVWLDGTRLGETPLNAAAVPLGVHEIVVKRAAGGERRFTVTIGARPFTLNVDF
jgi:hypothetical protein